MSDLDAVRAAYVNQMQRAFHGSTRGIPTPEQRRVWEQEFRDVIARVQAEAQVQALRDAADSWHAEHAGTRPGPYKWIRQRAETIAREAGIEQEDAS